MDYKLQVICWQLKNRIPVINEYEINCYMSKNDALEEQESSIVKEKMEGYQKRGAIKVLESIFLRIKKENKYL